jgi:hypothetical protein
MIVFASDNICRYRIAKSTSEDLYNDEKLIPWEQKAYQKIDLDELYIFCVFKPTLKKLYLVINFFLWLDYGLVIFS